MDLCAYCEERPATADSPVNRLRGRVCEPCRAKLRSDDLDERIEHVTDVLRDWDGTMSERARLVEKLWRLRGEREEEALKERDR